MIGDTHISRDKAIEIARRTGDVTIKIMPGGWINIEELADLGDSKVSIQVNSGGIERIVCNIDVIENRVTNKILAGDMVKGTDNKETAAYIMKVLGYTVLHKCNLFETSRISFIAVRSFGKWQLESINVMRKIRRHTER